MDLPIRIVDAPLAERVISVDGAWDQPGLNLSHWPGNRTPAELKHELSTGVALNFARLPDARRRELAAGCVAIANNHADTDGACAIFAVRHPEAALAREPALLATAAAGDFFRGSDERAVSIDLVVHGLYEHERSPWRERFPDLAGRAWHEAVTRELVALLPELLDGALEPWADLWRPGIEDLRADQADLARATREEIAHLDLALYTAESGATSSRTAVTRSSREAGAGGFDPGRHALFGASDADRVLLVGPRAGGATYRLIFNTTSWFDLAGPVRLARPDLGALAARLNELEGASGAADVRWRAQDARSPAPELWFGRAAERDFAEHAPGLEASRLAPRIVKAELLEALRAAWSFPDA